VASSQPVTWPLRASELAKLGLQVPAARNSPERLPGGTPGGRRDDRHPPPDARSGVSARSRRTTGPPGPAVAGTRSGVRR